MQQTNLKMFTILGSPERRRWPAKIFRFLHRSNRFSNLRHTVTTKITANFDAFYSISGLTWFANIKRRTHRKTFFELFMPKSVFNKIIFPLLQRRGGGNNLNANYSKRLSSPSFRIKIVENVSMIWPCNWIMINR